MYERSLRNAVVRSRRNSGGSWHEAGRKEVFAAYLVEALDLEEIPRPLDLLLRHVIETAGGA